MTKKSDYDIGAMPHDWQTDLNFGHKGEKLVSEFLAKISSGAFEVKTDRYRNGRMVVEMVQNPRRRMDNNGQAVWQPSGLAVTKAEWWVYVYALDGAFVIVSVPRLKRYLKANKSRFSADKYHKFAWRSGNPSMGYLLQPEDVMDMMINEKYDSR